MPVVSGAPGTAPEGVQRSWLAPSSVVARLRISAELRALIREADVQIRDLKTVRQAIDAELAEADAKASRLFWAETRGTPAVP